MDRVRHIPLYRRDGSVCAYAMVDDADFAWLTQRRWFKETKGYAVHSEWRQDKYCLIRMHRLVLGLEVGDPRVGDHRNGDRLDNRRVNLRVASDAQNNQNRIKLNANNTSGFRGVTWNKERRKWTAACRINRHRHHLGYFEDAKEAAAAIEAFRAEHMPFSQDAMAA